MNDIKNFFGASWDQVKLNLWEHMKLNLPELIGEKVVYTDVAKKSEIHIIDWLWDIYCANDNGVWFLNRIINGGNIKTLAEYFKNNLPTTESIKQWQRKIKRIILAIGLEVCEMSNDGLMLGGSAISDENTDELLYKVFYDANSTFSINSLTLNYQGTKKVFIRDMIPKLYTVPSKYRFLDTTDIVSESGIYASAKNIEVEIKKIYNDTVQEFRELYSDITDDEFSNYINISSDDDAKPIISEGDSVRLVLANDAPINPQEEQTPDTSTSEESQDSLIITLSNIMNSTKKYDPDLENEKEVTYWEKKKEFILLFFKNLRERTINYK